MDQIKYEVEINAPVGQVFSYYTNPDNIEKAWPRDIVKNSEQISSSNINEGAEMKVEGEYMKTKHDMIVEVKEYLPNKRLITEQKDGPFEKWTSIQEFVENGENHTFVRHVIEYELPTTGKILNFISGNDVKKKLQEGLEQSSQVVKQIIETS